MDDFAVIMKVEHPFCDLLGYENPNLPRDDKVHSTMQEFEQVTLN